MIDMPDYSVSSALEDMESLHDMIYLVMGTIQGMGPAAISQAKVYIDEAIAEIDEESILVTQSVIDAVEGMLNGVVSLAGLYGEFPVNQPILGPYSGAVRGYNCGPMSGAAVDPLSSVLSLAETSLLTEKSGRSLINALLEIALFGQNSVSATGLSLYGGLVSSVSLTTPVGIQQSANQLALINMVRNFAIIFATKVAARIDFKSYDETVSVMDLVVKAIDDHLLKLGDDAKGMGYTSFNVKNSSAYFYQALEGLRPAFVQSMKTIGAERAKILLHEVPPSVENSLVLVYDRYEDLDREGEIISRNLNIKHPGFLPSGDTVEVLNE